LLLALGGVSTIRTREDPYVGFKSASRLFTPIPDTEGASGRVRTAPNKRALFNDQTFTARKPAGTYRIFTLGGSTTYGRPYFDRTSFSGWLRVYLAAADPSRSWEVINAGGISYASYRVAALMEELIEYEPDLFIIYSGHNEFLERRTYSGIIDEHPAVTTLNLLANRSRIYSGMMSLKRRLAPDAYEQAQQRYALEGEVTALLDASAGLDRYWRDDALAAQILDHYRFNLGRMALLARSAGSEIVFVTTPSNHKDFSPFKSEHTEGLDASQLSAWQSRIDTAAGAAARGDHVASVEALREAVAIDPRYARTHYDLGRSLWALERYDEAAAAFARAVEEDIVPLRALPAMTDAVIAAAGRHGVPLVDFTALLTERSRARGDHGLLGDAEFLDHVHPTIEGHRILGRALLDHLVTRGVAKPDSAWHEAKARSIAAALLAELTPRDHGIALRNLAMVLRWAGKKEESARLLASASELVGDDAETLNLIGKQHFDAGRLDAALDFLRRAVALDPGLAAAQTNYGVVLLRLGRDDDAMQAFRNAIRHDPDNGSAHANLGAQFFKRGALDDAVAHYREWVRIDPNSADGYARLAVALSGLNKYDEAFKYFLRSFELAPDDPETRRAYGAALANADRLDEAIEQFRRSLSHRPDDALTLADLGQALMTAGQSAEAIEPLRRALRLDPALATASYRLGRILAEQRDFRGAIDAWGTGAEHNPDDETLANALAWLLATCPVDALRDGPRAVILAQRADRLTGARNPRVCLTLLAAHAENGDLPQALEAARRGEQLATAAGNRGLARDIRDRAADLERGRTP